MRVWENFVKRLPEGVGTLSSSAIKCLATWQINGREIKNILNMAVSWCRKKGHELDLETVENLLGTICPSARKEEDTLPTNGVEAGTSKEASHDMSLLDF